MTVEFKIAAGFKHYTDRMDGFISGVPCTIEPGHTVSDLLDAVQFPQTVAVNVFVNGRLGHKQTLLRDGDTLFLSQPMAGG